MSRLEELIKEKCPEGVEFRNLSDCCNILDNKRKPVTKSAREKGKYPYYGANGIQDYVSDYIFDGTFVLVGEDGSVITPSGNPVVNWAEGKIWVNNHAHIIEEIDGVLLRYLYYYIQSVNVRELIHGNIPKLNQGDFKNIRVAVPPLEVQQEIVHVLDNFSLLSAELSAELKARQKQYEYYRNKLLSFEETAETLDTLHTHTHTHTHGYFNEQKIEWLKLIDIAVRNKGTAITAQKMKEINKKDGKVKVFAAGNTIAYVDVEDIPKEDIIMLPSIIVKSRGYIGFEYYDKPFTNKAELWSYTVDNRVNQKYVYYYLLSKQKELQKTARAQSVKLPQIYHYNTDNLLIPIPSIDIQEKIVNILDKFDKLTTDISEGLPAEIEVRQKQYEYYRNKLLTFKELV